MPLLNIRQQWTFHIMDEIKTLILNVTRNCAINLVVNVSNMVHTGRRHIRTRRQFNTYTRARHAMGVSDSKWMDFKFMYQWGYKIQPFCPEIHSLKQIHWICTRLFKLFLSSQFLLQGEHLLIPTYVHDQQYHSARLWRCRTANAFHLAFLTMI